MCASWMSHTHSVNETGETAEIDFLFFKDMKPKQTYWCWETMAVLRHSHSSQYIFHNVFLAKCLHFVAFFLILSYNHNIIILLLVSFKNRSVTESLGTNLVCIPFTDLGQPAASARCRPSLPVVSHAVWLLPKDVGFTVLHHIHCLLPVMPRLRRPSVSQWASEGGGEERWTRVSAGLTESSPSYIILSCFS